MRSDSNRTPSSRQVTSSRPSTAKSRLGLRRLVESFATSRDERIDTRRGRLLLERLESRQLMAGDVELMFTGADDGNSADLYASASETSDSGSSQLQTTTQAEGEAAADLVQFAQALTDAGVQFFGAAWCPACTQQKQLFEDGANELPFIEVTGPNRELNDVGVAEGINEFPTWEFPDGSRAMGVLSLQTLSERSGVAIPQSEAPAFEEVGSQTVQIGSPLHIPIDAYDPNGGPLTVTVSVDNPSLLQATVIGGNRSLRLDMEGYGDMVFELFEQRAPRPAGRVADLAEAGFYDGIVFHRVIDGFMIQGGDPTGTGTDGSPLGAFDDQFHPDLQHNTSGMLSFAKTSDDTNNSQFFITEVATRHLDFNHSIFGQLVEGDEVREAISETQVDSNDRPSPPITISSASVFQDAENSVVMLKALAGTGQTSVTITVTDEDGNTHSEVVQVNVVNDSTNNSPFLGEITDPAAVDPDTAAQLQLTSTDVEGDAVTYYGALTSGSTGDATLTVDSTTGEVTVTPAAGFTGTVDAFLAVRAASSASNTDNFDSQRVTFSFEGEALAAPTAIDLLSSSDSGSSSTDNITNAASLSFRVSGVTNGSTVEIIDTATNTVVGTATASGTTATVTTNNIAALGDGTFTLAARQKSGSQSSEITTPITLLYDSTSPSPVAGSATTQANVGREYTTDLINDEEGAGLVYAISSGPSGATIDSTSGVIEWTPTQSQLGANTLTVKLTDKAGNVRTESFNVQVAESPVAEIRLETTDLNGNPISSIAVGETFLLKFYGVDARNALNRRGIFAAYADVLFDSSLVRPESGATIQYDSEFPLQRTGSFSSGLINELGAAASDLVPPDQAESLVATIRMEALASGSVNIRSEPADASSSEMLLYLEDDQIPASAVAYGNAVLAIGQSFTVADDTLTVAEDSSATVVDVLDNDTVVSGSSSLSVVSVTQPASGGTVTLSGGNVRFTPDADFFGTAEFTYRVSDSNGVQENATVTVSVTAVNDPPTGVADQFDVDAGSSANSLDVLANDSMDPDAGETLSVTAVSASSAGATLSVSSDGESINYTPPAGFTGADSFTYTLSDGSVTREVNVSVTVAPADPPPTANADAFTVTEDATEAEFDVLGNDTADESDQTFVLDAVGSASHDGTARISSDGTKFFYQPADDFTGTETVTYTIRDSGGGIDVGTVTFTVTGVNDPPPVSDTAAHVNRGDGEQTVLELDHLPENVDTGETLRFTTVGSTSKSGTVRLNSAKTAVLYTPPSGSFTGTDTFTYTVSDGNGLTASGTMTVHVNDFSKRTISLNLHAAQDFARWGAALTLTGTNLLGETVEESIAPGDGAMEFADLLPGDYMIKIPAVPFLQNAAEPRQIAVTSAADDGDEAVDIDLGLIRAEHLSLRDGLGSTRRESMLIAVAPGEAPVYASVSSLVDLIDDPMVQMNADGTEITITGTQIDDKDTSSTSDDTTVNVSATLPVSGDHRVQVRGQSGDLRLLKISLDARDVSFKPVTSSASSNTASQAVVAESVVASRLADTADTSTGSDAMSTAASTTSHAVALASDPSDSASSTLSVGDVQAEGESAAAESVTRADVFTPAAPDGTSRTDATVLAVPGSDLWLGQTLRGVDHGSNEISKQTPVATDLLASSHATDSSSDGQAVSVDSAMSEVAESLTRHSRAAEAMAEANAAPSTLYPSAVDAVLSADLG